MKEWIYEEEAFDVIVDDDVKIIKRWKSEVRTPLPEIEEEDPVIIEREQPVPELLRKSQEKAREKLQQELIMRERVVAETRKNMMKEVQI